MTRDPEFLEGGQLSGFGALSCSVQWVCLHHLCTPSMQHKAWLLVSIWYFYLRKLTIFRKTEKGN